VLLDVLVADKKRPDVFDNVSHLYAALKDKGLMCGQSTLDRMINPNAKCNRAAGIPPDLAMSTITPDKWRAFEAGITTWTGGFNFELYEFASILLAPGWFNMDMNEKMSHAGKKRFVSPESKEKIRAEQLERWASLKYRENQVKTHTGRKASSEAREKMSRSGKKRFSLPGEREKQSDNQKDRWSRPGTREDQSKKIAEWWDSPAGRAARKNLSKRNTDRHRKKRTIPQKAAEAAANGRNLGNVQKMSAVRIINDLSH
jgi:hypothetical protein